MFQFLIPAAAAIFGASKASSAAKSAAATQAAAADRATELQREQFERQVELQEPWRRSGIAAQNQLLTLLGINPNPPSRAGGAFGMFGFVPEPTKTGADSGLTVDTSSPQFGKYGKAFSETNFTADPGYAFRLSEGMKALERSAAARGGLLSGATLKGVQRYGQGLASQEYQNAFDRYYAERNAALNPLQSLAGVGQTSTQQLGAAGQAYAGNVGNALIGQGQAAANASLARGSAYQRGLSDIGYMAGRYYGGGNYMQPSAPISEATPYNPYTYPGQD